MGAINFKVTPFDDYTIIEFSINDIKPADLKSTNPPDAVKLGFADKGIILSGRGPIWLYGFLIHFYHPTKFVATHDPRLKGAVVIETHSGIYKVGDVISMEIQF